MLLNSEIITSIQRYFCPRCNDLQYNIDHNWCRICEREFTPDAAWDAFWRYPKASVIALRLTEQEKRKKR